MSGRDVEEVVDGVYLTQLAAGEEMSVLHYHIYPGARVPEHSHPHEQVGFVYSGTVTFEVGGEEFVLGTGESYSIPGDEPHAAVNNADHPVDGIDVFSPPRLDVPWLED